MPSKGEDCESAHWRIDVDDETGKPFWRGAGSGDKEESVFGPGEALIMRPGHFPPGTRVVVIEPWDEAFYGRLFRGRRDDPPRVIIKTTITADGWTTKVTMPDGSTCKRSMRREENGGLFRGTRKGSFEDDGLPDCVIEAADNSALIDVAQYLDGQGEG